MFEKHKVTNFQRLLKLTDAQWSRLNLPLGVEASIRDAISQEFPNEQDEEGQQSLPQSNSNNINRNSTNGPQMTSQPKFEKDKDHFFRQDANGDPDEFGEEDWGAEHTEGLRQRSCRRSTENDDAKEDYTPLINVPLDPPEDLHLLWEQLLEDCLPPDKRKYIMQTWNRCQDDRERYMMFLEYSSYLRSKHQTNAEKKQAQESLGPLINQYMGLGKSPNTLFTHPKVLRITKICTAVLVIAGLWYGSVMFEDDILSNPF